MSHDWCRQQYVRVAAGPALGWAWDLQHRSVSELKCDELFKYYDKMADKRDYRT